MEDLCFEHPSRIPPGEAQRPRTISSEHLAVDSRTSQAGTCKVLETMLRIEVKHPQQRVLNLIGEYEDYLEETGLVDLRDVKRRNNLQQNSDENEDAKSVAEGEEQAVEEKPPVFEEKHPLGGRTFGYNDVLKKMITRLELEGTIGRRREYGRKTKGFKINEERDEEYYYNLDDDFIDDKDLINNESMNRDFSQQEFHNEEDVETFYKNFEFLP